jgi:hypothetical protein
VVSKTKFAMTDCRVLTFGRHALVEVMEHAGQVLGYMPPGTVHAVELLPDEQMVWFKLGPEIGDIQLGGPELAALLIGYCNGARIPLPMVARKRLVVDKHHVRIEFLICDPDPPRYQRDGRHLRHGGDVSEPRGRSGDTSTTIRKRAHEW